MLFMQRMPLGIFRHPTEGGRQAADIIIDPFACGNIPLLASYPAQTYQTGSYPACGMDMSEEFHLIVEIA